LKGTHRRSVILGYAWGYLARHRVPLADVLDNIFVISEPDSQQRRRKVFFVCDTAFENLSESTGTCADRTMAIDGVQARFGPPPECDGLRYWPLRP
jgi:hypothetical protein